MSWSREDHLTVECVNYFRMQYKKATIYHIANERDTKVVKKRNGKTYSPRGMKLKRMGVLAGVSDLHIPTPSGRYPGFYLELKHDEFVAGKRKRVGYPSPEQLAFLAARHDEGHAVAVAWNFDEFKMYVDEYMAGNDIQCEYLIKNNHIEVTK